MKKFQKIKTDINDAKIEYVNGVENKKRYRYTIIGVVAVLVVVLLVVSVYHVVVALTDNRILKPGEVDFENEHTPVFIDENSEDYYLESGLFAPAVVADFTKLQSGYIIDNGPVANLVKNYVSGFDTADNADDGFLLSFGLWEALYEEVYNTKGVVEENGKTYISYEVVDAAIKEYFEVKEMPSHLKTVDVFGTFSANDERQAYISESTGFEDSLVARVLSVKSTSEENATKDEKGNDVKAITTYVELAVECISSNDELEYETDSGAEPEVYASLVIKIRVDPDGSYKFLSVIDTNAPTEQPVESEKDVGADTQTQQ